MKTTIGQVLVNESLPEDMRDYNRVWDKQTTKKVLKELADKHPELYRTTSHRLLQLGQHTSTAGNFSFSLSDFLPGQTKQKLRKELSRKADAIIDNPKLSPKQKKEKLTILLGDKVDTMVGGVLDEGVKRGSRLAEIIKGGAKGSASQYNTTVGAPLLVLGPDDEPVPVPIFNSVSEGYDPAEYWASAYGMINLQSYDPIGCTWAGNAVIFIAVSFAELLHKRRATQRACVVAHKTTA